MMYDAMTIVWREMMVFKRRLGTFLFTRMVSPLLYLVTFGLGLGKSIQMAGTGSYLDFVVSGIVALNSMMVSFNAVASPVCMSRILYMTFDEYQTAPISNISYVCGQAIAASIRALISSFMIVIIAWLFGATLHITPLFLLVLIANALIFAFLGITAAMFVNSHENLNTLTTYLIMPMSFLCGTFFRVENFPPVLKNVIEFLPLTPASSLLRAIGSGSEPVLSNLLLMAIYLVATASVAVWSIGYVKR